MEDIFEKLAAAMPLFQSLFPEDAHVFLCDREKILRSLPGQDLNLGIKEGTPISEWKGAAAERAMSTQKNVRTEIGPEKFGIPYIGIGIPILQDGKVIGALSAAISNQRFEQLRSYATDLAATIEELTSTTDEIASASNHIAEKTQEAALAADEVVKFLHEIEGISKFVHDVSAQTNLLGLNAAIEAARAGDTGRGFSVVAEEIRRLSASTKKATAEINSNLEKIQSLIQSSNDAIHNISADSEEHATTIQELKAVFEHIAHMADSLITMSKI